MNIHEKYIKRCIDLAKNGVGNTYPNPMVGSVIVVGDKVIGEGWHRKAGEAHAEVNAIRSVVDKEQLKNATIYVSLEPCSHFGKTPPCAHLIVESGIKKVVVAILDSNEKVSGKGVEYLKEHGCEVIVGVMENEALNLNKRFFTFHDKKRPFIILKWAETKDGFIDKDRTQASENAPNWISNGFSQQLVHKLRSEEEAILVGTTTVINDNPSLNSRKWFGSDPLRLAIDKNLKIPNSYNLVDGQVKTILFSKSEGASFNNKLTSIVNLNFESELPIQICEFLFQNEIQSVIIEGGAKTINSFIDAGLWDEAYVYIGRSMFLNGITAPKIKIAPISVENIATDVLYTYCNL